MNEFPEKPEPADTQAPELPPDSLQDSSPESRLQARTLKARAGWTWVGQGWRLFRMQPMTIMGILSLYMLALLLVSTLLNLFGQGLSSVFSAGFAHLITSFGAAIFAATVPGITAGFMDVCKNVQMKLPIHFALLLKPFKSGKTIRNRLLILGAIQVIALFLVLSITPDVQLSSVPVTAKQSTTATTVQTPQQAEGVSRNVSPGSPQAIELSMEDRQKILTAYVWQLILYMPFTLILWYAPMLVYWHGCGVIKAMFFSIAAIWRNRGAFTMYGLGMALAIFLAANVMGLIVLLVGAIFNLGQGSMAVLAPLVIAMFTWAYCTIYFSYTSVFSDETPKLQP